VSGNWGIGVAAQLLLASMRDKDASALGGMKATWTLSAFSVLFSATFN
jgi:hypothetical protein